MDVEDIRHVAELAELSLTPEEEKRLAEEIGRIVAYVKELDAVDTTNVEPTFQVVAQSEMGGRGAWRSDEAKPGLSHDDALAAAPETGHGGFVVPTFVGS